MGKKLTGILILGGLLITVTSVVFAMSKEGRELTEKLKKELQKMTIHLKERLAKLHNVTKEDFDELVTTLVDEYAKKKELSIDSKDKITSVLKSKWNEIKKEYVSEVS